ncbi:extracellular serine proteinase-like [Amphiura filiformis]|uniref:extracellular serine proteinase-like n=1 Tax=Amphiura filiformis TaxID=82378 RepID=UPI003B20F924
MDISAMSEGITTQVRHKYRKVLNGFSLRIPDQYVEWLQNLKGVEYVQEVGSFHLAGSAASWGLDRIDQRDQPTDGQYSPVAFGTGVNVYVIDSGIHLTHVDFEGRVTAFKDFINDGLDGGDCHGHGTAVAGVIGGTVYGVAKDVNLFSCRVHGCYGSTIGTKDFVIAAMDDIASRGTLPGVVSVTFTSAKDDTLDTATSNLIDMGFSVVAPAGNDNNDACLYSPGSVKEVITVGSIHPSDWRSSYSNWGSCLDVFAPGAGISSDWHTSDTATIAYSSTSMACAHAAGAAAKILGINPQLTPAEVHADIVASATPDKIPNPEPAAKPGSPNLILYSP